MTYYEAVKNHLEDKGSITSKEAFERYGITRLSAVIHYLRNKEGMPIESRTETTKNRYGHTCVYTRYVQIPEQENGS